MVPGVDRPPGTRVVGRLLTLVVIGLLAAFFRHLGPLPVAASATMLLGFLLLAGFVAGELARELRLPRITGYLIIGIAFGPHTLGLFPADGVDFSLINEIALSLIALQAGGELRLERLRSRLGTIGTITGLQIVSIVIGVTTLVYLGSDLFPFLRGLPHGKVLAAALVFGLVAVATSPAATIAVITEMRARGAVADTVLGVCVVKDVAVLLLIAVVMPSAAVLIEPARGFDFSQLGEIVLVILLALTVGALIGWLIILYLRQLNVQPVLFVLAVAFIVVEMAHLMGLESESYILMSMAAGFVVQNRSVQGPVFIEALEANSLPLYALFFALAGAHLNLEVIPQVWRVGLLLIVLRVSLLGASTNLAVRATGDLPSIRRHAWLGFLSQAGVTLGLATIVQARLPDTGPAIATVIIAMIAVHELIGPPLFRAALVRSGESGAA